MLGKFSESAETNRNRNNPVVMPMMPPPLYASSSSSSSTTNTAPRRPNESIISGSSASTTPRGVNIVPSSPADTAVMIAAASGSSESTVVKQLAPQYQCQVCSKCFNSVATLSVHMSSHENSTQLEYRSNPGATTYNGHIVTTGSHVIKTEPQPFQIITPTTTETIYVDGGVHGFQVASTGGPGHTCQICQKLFSSPEQYHTHMKIHENEFRNRALYQASSSNSGPQSSVVVQQIPTVKQQDPAEEEDGMKPIDCIVCHKKFQTASQLAVHLREHNAEKPYRCTVCGKGFIQSNNLSTHMKVHSGQKPFKCDICGKHFSQSNNLKTHVRTHTNERPYACAICEKRFNQKNNLTTHMRTHSMTCKVCQTPFHHPTELSTHVRICYADQKPNICSICNKVFMNHEEMNDHMKQHNQ